MKIEFFYDIDKDVENFIKTLKPANDKELAPFHKLYIDKNGESFEPEKIKAFIQKYISSTDIAAAISKIEKGWVPIQGQFIERAENIFGIKYPEEKITAYLTTNNRCSYNTRRREIALLIVENMVMERGIPNPQTIRQEVGNLAKKLNLKTEELMDFYSVFVPKLLGKVFGCQNVSLTMSNSFSSVNDDNT